MATAKYSLSRKDKISKKVIDENTAVRKKIQKEEKKIVLENNGNYNRVKDFFYALEYYYGIDGHRAETMRKLILTAIMKNDVQLLDRILPVPLESMKKYERDGEWEKLSYNDKINRILQNNVPVYDRYKQEIEQLKSWNKTEDQIYKNDLVGVYRSYYKSVTDVGWIVTSKIEHIGYNTKMAWENQSSRILLHQMLYDGLKFSRQAITRYIQKAIEVPIILALLLHVPSHIKDNEWIPIMVNAAQNGMAEMVMYMNECGTLPNKDGLEKMISSLVVRCKDPSILKENENIDNSDIARAARIRLVERVVKLGDKEEAKRMREIYIPEGEELEKFYAQKKAKNDQLIRIEEKKKYEKKEVVVDESELIDINKIAEDLGENIDDLQLLANL